MGSTNRWLASLLAMLLILGLVLSPGFTATAEAGEADSDTTTESEEGEETAALAVTHIVRFFNWDNTLLGAPQTINDGESAVAPPEPNREGFRFTGWSPDFSNVVQDLDVYAQFEPLVNFTITIEYVFADNTIARQPVVFSVEAGDSLVQSVLTVAIAGYQADASSIDINLTNVQENHTYTVTYSPAGNTPYQVLHYQQKLTPVNAASPMDPANFDLIDTENKTGPTGTLAAAVAKAYTGFSAPSAMPSAVIAANGSTMLKVYYTRNQYVIYFNSNGGTYVAPISALFGATITAPTNPTRAGYTFGSWSSPVPGTMPAGDMTLTANWNTSGTVNYTRVFWLENITSTGYDYVGTTTSSGTAGAAPVLPANTSGVTFPIAATYFALNSTKSNAEKPTAISGDGTTIVNVYYDRNSYTVNFTFSNRYSVTAGGTTYSAGTYQLTAKYGAPINTKWPANPVLKSGQTSLGNFTGWMGTNETYVTTQFYMNAGLINDSPLAAQFNNQTKNVTVNYMFQNVTGSGYTSQYQQTVATENSTTVWNAKVFEGFTAQQNSVNITNNTATFYYTRNNYSIAYYNGNATVNTLSNILYGAAISGATYNYTPSRPTSVPNGYNFAGWYTTPQGYDNSKFNFTGATMPAYNLILYARWDKPTYTVSFVPDNGTTNFTQTVVAQGTATEPSAPTKAGYVFGGWYLSGATTHYVFNFPVTQNITLAARWVAINNVTYDVIYMRGGVEHSRQSFGGRMVGDTVTASAITIAGYLPDALSKSLTLAASGNQIVFNYSPFTAVGYTVRYRLADDPNTSLAPDRAASTSQASITENYVNVSGYSPDYYQQTLQLTPNAPDNVITFLYTKNADVNYTLRIFQENVGGGYTMTTDQVKQAPAGSTVTETPPVYTGFVYQPSLSMNGRVIASNGSTFIRLYYNRNQYAVTFSAQSNGSLLGQTSFSGIKYETSFGTAVTVPTVKPDPGYKLDHWEPALPQGSDLVTANAEYTAMFVKDSTQWATITYSANGGTGSMADSVDLLIGSNFTLPTNTFTKANNVYTNWNTGATGNGTAYGNGESIVVTGDMTLYAQWSPDPDYGVIYLPSGGTGTTVDSNRYFEDQEVTVLANGFARPGYQFMGWLLQGTDTVYQPGEKFFLQADTVLIAQWELDESQWTTIQYDKNHADATGSMTSEKVLTNVAHALKQNVFARPNYTFTGWSTVPGTASVEYSDSATVTPTPGGGTMTLYAQWEENTKYKITYNSNNPADLNVYGTPVYGGDLDTVLPSNTFTYAHNDFIRWNDQKNGLGNTYLPGEVVNLTENVTLYAVWKERALYTVTYLDGFSSDGDPQTTQLYADADGLLDLTVAANPYVRGGYQFVDWKDNADIHANPGAARLDLSANITFTAQWEVERYLISYDLDGGVLNGVNPTQYTIETVSFDLVNPVRPGYTFEGWTGTGLNGTAQSVTVVHGSRGNRTYTAHWTRDDAQWVNIIFVNSNPAQGSLTGLLQYEGIIGQPTTGSDVANVVLPSLMPTSGFLFSHWSVSLPDTFPDADLTITAYWKPESGSSGGSGSDGGSSSSSSNSSGSSSSRDSSSNNGSPGVGSSNSSPEGSSSGNRTVSTVAASGSGTSSSSEFIPANVSSGNDPQNGGTSDNGSDEMVIENQPTWALLNLLATIAAIAVTAVLSIGLFRKHADVGLKSGKRMWLRLLSILLGVALVIIFLLTQRFNGIMVMADMWTWIMLLLFTVQVVLALWVRRLRKNPIP